MIRNTPPPLPPRPRCTLPTPPPLPPKSTPTKSTPPPIPHKSTRPPELPNSLTTPQITAFLTHGILTIPSAIPPEKLTQFTSTLWPRLNADPTNLSTWSKERTHLPPTRKEHLSTFAPPAWRAICELLGGEDRVDVDAAYSSDAFIVNLGVPGSEPDPTGRSIGPELWDWHVDGDFFVHFLDSREQGLLVIPVFSDIEAGGGGTMVASEGIGRVAKHLWEHPEGVQPGFSGDGKKGWFVEQARECTEFIEITGKAGDVVLLHPFMLHSASRNWSRVPRVITNPRVGLKKPFTYGRDGSEVSLVERKTLMELRLMDLGGWCITGERRGIVPERVRKLKEEEERKRVQG